MKIIALSDTHNNHYVLDYWLIENETKIKNCDLIIFAGDSSDSKNPTKNFKEQMDFLKWYKTIPIKNKIFVPGNHNVSENLLTDEDYKSMGITRLINQSVNIMGYNIFGSPYTEELGSGWNFQIKEKDTDFWDIIPNNTDILITHGMPYGKLDKVSDKFDYPSVRLCGDKNLLHKIEQIHPQLVIGGHIHDGEFEHPKNNGILSENGVMYANVSIVDNTFKVLNKPTFITLK